jgi:hypothetical protein
VEFLSDEQVAAYGRFTGELSAGEVERFFYLDDADRHLIVSSATLYGSGPISVMLAGCDLGAGGRAGRAERSFKPMALLGVLTGLANTDVFLSGTLPPRRRRRCGSELFRVEAVFRPGVTACVTGRVWRGRTSRPSAV